MKMNWGATSIMTTYYDLIKDKSFQENVKSTICLRTGLGDYNTYDIIPSLYRYRPFSKYAIEDIENQTITLSSIGEFNDIYDGTIHILKEGESYSQLAEKKLAKLETMGLDTLGINEQTKISILQSFKRHYEKEGMLKQRTLEKTGTYVGCFSENRRSILMWAHYANYNQGLCIEYDFNDSDVIVKNSVFPVAYVDKPLYLYDLMKGPDKPDYPYQLDAAFICAAIAKNDIWKYEEESRLIIQDPYYDNRRFPLKIKTWPLSITLGNDFLKNFFYYDRSDNNELKRIEEAYSDLKKLLELAESNNFTVYVVDIIIGEFGLQLYKVDNTLLNDFFSHQLQWEPQDIRFYYVLKDQFFELIHKSGELILGPE